MGTPPCWLQIVRRSGSSLLTSAPRSTRPAPSRPCAASALPAGREPRQPPLRGKQTRLSSGLELTVPGPGAGFLLQRIVPANPFRPGTVGRSLNHGRVGCISPLIAVYGCLLGGLKPEETPRAPLPSGRPVGGKRSRVRGSPSLT